MGSSYLPATVGPAGLVIPNQPAIQSYLIAQFLATFGAASYLGPDSLDMQDIGIRAQQASDVNEAAQAVWLQFNPQTAIGTSLDLIGKSIGTARNQATYSTAVLTVTGIPGSIINGGTARDVVGYLWNLPPVVTIPSGGSINVTAIAQIIGNITANAGTITNIGSPTAGWTGVTNGGAAVPGEPVELDSQYRARLLISQAKPSLSLIAGTAAAIAAVSGVTRSEVYENQYGYTASIGLLNTSGTGFTVTQGYPLDSSDVGQAILIAGTSYTIATITSATTGTLTSSAGTQPEVAFAVGLGGALGPAHSITCIIENGLSSSIAQAIYANKNPGVLTNGTTTISVIDPNNGDISIAISFDILGYQQIYVAMNVHALAGFTSATEATIIGNIVTYLNSLGIGETVVYSSLYGPALAANPNPTLPLFSIKSLTSGYEAAQTTGTTVNASPSIALTSQTGVAVSQVVVGAGIPNNTTVSSVGNATTLTVHAAGITYTTATGLSTTGGSGTGLTVNIVASGGNITSATVANEGAGYLAGDIVTVVQGGGASGGQLNITAIAITISANATASASGVALSFFTVGDSDIPVQYNQASQAQITNVVITLV